MTILISGATGRTGGEVRRQLQEAGVAVRAMTRSEQSAARLRDGGVDAVVGDLSDPDSLAAALGGIDGIYVATTTTPELATLQGNLARAAAAAGVGHVVKLSVVGASPDSTLAFARLHHEAEQAIRDTGLRWTMVRPNGFMQNTLSWAGQIPSGTIRGPVMDARWAIVDVRDIAAVAVAALTDPERHAGQTYEVSGPEASSPREQVRIISELLDLPLAAEEVTIEQAQASMLEVGMPEWAVERLGELYEFYAAGLGAGVSGDVERVTGRPARDYRQFATDHAGAFTT